MSPEPRELAYPGPLGRGAHGPGVRRVQEWLGLAGAAYRVGIDRMWGRETEDALFAFQVARRLVVEPRVSPAAWEALAAPLRRATSVLPTPGTSPREALVEIARGHLQERPREIGGPNRGPWPRHYTGGAEVAWCAGALRTWVRQSRAAQGLAPLGWLSLRVAEVARAAEQLGRLVTPDGVQAGDVGYWLNPDRSGHIFLVAGFDGELLVTIEGNTDDGGSREGDGVYARRRPRRGLRFLRVD